MIRSSNFADQPGEQEMVPTQRRNRIPDAYKIWEGADGLAPNSTCITLTKLGSRCFSRLRILFGQPKGVAGSDGLLR
jgi:hypothetical protein